MRSFIHSFIHLSFSEVIDDFVHHVHEVLDAGRVRLHELLELVHRVSRVHVQQGRIAGHGRGVAVQAVQNLQATSSSVRSYLRTVHTYIHTYTT